MYDLLYPTDGSSLGRAAPLPPFPPTWLEQMSTKDRSAAQVAASRVDAERRLTDTLRPRWSGHRPFPMAPLDALSGLSAAAWADLVGVNPRTIQRWRSRRAHGGNGRRVGLQGAGLAPAMVWPEEWHAALT